MRTYAHRPVHLNKHKGDGHKKGTPTYNFEELQSDDKCTQRGRADRAQYVPQHSAQIGLSQEFAEIALLATTLAQQRPWGKPLRMMVPTHALRAPHSAHVPRLSGSEYGSRTYCNLRVQLSATEALPKAHTMPMGVKISQERRRHGKEHRIPATCFF